MHAALLAPSLLAGDHAHLAASAAAAATAGADTFVAGPSLYRAPDQAAFAGAVARL